MLLDAFPLTSNGKDRRALAAPARIDGTAACMAPTTAAEELCVESQQSYFEPRASESTTSFFEPAGHSCLASQFVARIGSDHRVDVSVGALFENPNAAKPYVQFCDPMNQEDES